MADSSLPKRRSEEQLIGETFLAFATLRELLEDLMKREVVRTSTYQQYEALREQIKDDIASAGDPYRDVDLEKIATDLNKNSGKKTRASAT